VEIGTVTGRLSAQVADVVSGISYLVCVRVDEIRANCCYNDSLLTA
jgi:hypothetical protein